MSGFSLHQLSKLVMKVLFLTDISCFAIADPRGMGLQTASTVGRRTREGFKPWK